MIKKLKRYSLITLIMSMFLLLNTTGVLAADDGVFNFGTKIIKDVNKVWIVTFRDDVDFSSVTNNIQIKDVTTGTLAAINLVQDDDKAIVKIKAPSEGYIAGHNYQISLSKDIKMVNNSFLGKNCILNFVVAAKDNDYTISASVKVSPTINIFKQITVNSTNLPGAVKYKIEGNNNLFDIGKTMLSVVATDTVKVYIYDSLGNVIGTANMDVSTTKSDMKFNLQ